MKNTFKATIKDPYIYIAVAFTGLLALYEYLLLPFQPNDFIEVYYPLQKILIPVVSYLIIPPLFWYSFNSKLLPRLACFLLFASGILTEYGYAFAMGRFSIMQDYILGLQAVDLRLIANAMAAYLGQNIAMLFPILAYGVLLIWTRKRNRLGFGGFALAMAPIVLFYISVMPFSRGTFQTLSYSAGWRTLIFTGVRWVNSYHGPRETVPVIFTQKPVNNVVLVVDESVRGDHLSLNGYSRETTPYLEQLQRDGRLYNWGIAASGATSSLNANLLLFTGIYQLPDVQQNTLRKPSIMQYAKSMGYTTYYIDVQMDRPWLLGQRDLAFVDHLEGAKRFQQGRPASEFDFAAAQYLHEILKNTGGNFIWINKMGDHFPYPAVVPPDKNIWQPAEMDLIYSPDRVVEITNSYDNVLAYNLDTFFKILLGENGLPDTTIVYTSDHGQTLSEHGESWPHSGNTRNEALVPLFIIADQPLQVDTGYRASHANIFATLLDFMGVPNRARTAPYGISLLKARSSDNEPRFYIFGTIDSQIGSEVRPFDQQ